MNEHAECERLIEFWKAQVAAVDGWHRNGFDTYIEGDSVVHSPRKHWWRRIFAPRTSNDWMTA